MGDTVVVPIYWTATVYSAPTVDGTTDAAIRWTSALGIGNLEIDYARQGIYGSNLIQITLYGGEPGQEATISYSDGRYFVVRVAEAAAMEPAYLPPADLKPVQSAMAQRAQATPIPTPLPTAQPAAPQLCQRGPTEAGTASGRLLLNYQHEGFQFALLDIATGKLDPITAYAASYTEIPISSPDGQQLAFIKRQRLMVMHIDGSAPQQLADLIATETPPSWSPDGQWLVFSATPPREDTQMRFGLGAAELYAIRPDGSDLTRLTYTEEHEVGPLWSPDGVRILYTIAPVAPGISNYGPDAKRARIGIFDLASRQITVIADERRHNITPLWSPDGSRVAFLQQPQNLRVDEEYVGQNNEWLFTVNADGTGLQQLTPPTLRAYAPSWSPDGEWLTFGTLPISKRLQRGPTSAYVMRADGSCWRQVVQESTEQTYLPQWSPYSNTLALLSHQNPAPLVRPPVYGAAIQLVDATNRRPTNPQLMAAAAQDGGQFSEFSWYPACTQQPTGCELPQFPFLDTLYDENFAPPDSSADVALQAAAAVSTTTSISETILRAQVPKLPTEPLVTAINTYPSKLVTADFNRDGAVDIAMVDNSGITILLGNGDGSLYQGASYAVDVTYGVLIAGDVNGDDYVDLVSTTRLTPGMNVLLGNGDGTFTSRTQAVDAEITHLLGVEDTDHDGQSEIILIEGVLLQNAHITQYGWSGTDAFTQLASAPIAGLPIDLQQTWADVNQDGDQDVTVVFGRSLLVYYGDEEEPFSKLLEISIDGFRATTGSTDNLIRVADLNQDGVGDFVMAVMLETDRNDPERYAIVLLLSAGMTRYQLPQIIEVATVPALLDLRDVNGDGLLDIVAAGKELEWLLGQPDGAFTTLSVGSLHEDALAELAIADMNNDGKQDFIVARTNPVKELQVWLVE